MKEDNEEFKVELNENESEKTYSIMAELRSWIKIIVISVLVGLAISSVVKPTLVVGESMASTLSNGDYLIMNRLAYKMDEPSYKDIIVFKTDLPGDRILIKRVIATEGQHIVIKDNQVFVDDALLDEKDYIHAIPTHGEIDAIVPQDSVFVMGDNRTNSLDSRSSSVGFVKTDTVLGKVMFRLFPMKGIQD